MPPSHLLSILRLFVVCPALFALSRMQAYLITFLPTSLQSRSRSLSSPVSPLPSVQLAPQSNHYPPAHFLPARPSRLAASSTLTMATSRVGNTPDASCGGDVAFSLSER
ncbi:unnamed protein product, partial [Protopolystoma xenopodis]